MKHYELHELELLIERARSHHMSEDEAAAQRNSFAYGNSAIENPNITREMVEEEARRIGM